jgi:hypothetical protein
MPCPNCGGSGGSATGSVCLKRGNGSVIARGGDGCYQLPKIVDSGGAALATNGSGDQVLPASSGGGTLSLDNLSDVAISAAASGQIIRHNGATWVNTSAGYIPEAIAMAKGDLIVATSTATLVRLPLGSTGQVLTADAAETAGVKWATPAGGGGGGGAVVLTDLTDVTVTSPVVGDVLRNNGSGQFVNTPGLAWFEVADAVADHVALPDPHGQYLQESVVAAKGDLLAGTGLSAVARLATGAAGQVLKVNTATTTGLEWAADIGIPVTLVDAKGDLIVGTAADTAARFPVGADGQVLTANSATSSGLSWAAGGGGSSADSLVDHATPTGTTEALDLATGNVHRVRWDANVTLSLLNVPAGLAHFYLILYHDSSSTAYTVTWWSGIAWETTQVSLSDTPDGIHFFEFWSHNGGTTWVGLHGPKGSPSNNQTGSYTLVLADAGKTIEMNVASANTLTVPPNSSVAFPVGTVINWEQHGAGTTTLTAGAGVTLNSRGGVLASAGQYGAGSMRKTATNTWLVAGDLA